MILKNDFLIIIKNKASKVYHLQYVPWKDFKPYRKFK